MSTTENLNEMRANILANQHRANSEASGIFLSGKDMRKLKRSYLRAVKAGKYDHIFDDNFINEKFNKLNAPPTFTEKDIPDDVKDRLLEMVDEEPWHEIKPDA